MIPDDETGEPRPPTAPLIETRNDKNSDEGSRRRPPTPPPGLPPMLEYHHMSIRLMVGIGLTVVAFFAIVTLLQILRYGTTMGDLFEQGPAILVFLALLVSIVAGPVAMGIRIKLTVGARWFAVRSRWVDLYDLVDVKLVGDSPQLRLRDSAGRRVRVAQREIESNRRLWDLVYNGIRYSEAHGQLQADRHTRWCLQLPRDPADPPPPPSRSARRRAARRRARQNRPRII